MLMLSKTNPPPHPQLKLKEFGQHNKVSKLGKSNFMLGPMPSLLLMEVHVIKQMKTGRDKSWAAYL